MSQEKSKTMPMQIFWRVEAVYFGIEQVVNRELQFRANFWYEGIT